MYPLKFKSERDLGEREREKRTRDLYVYLGFVKVNRRSELF